MRRFLYDVVLLYCSVVREHVIIEEGITIELAGICLRVSILNRFRMNLSTDESSVGILGNPSVLPNIDIEPNTI